MNPSSFLGGLLFVFGFPVFVLFVSAGLVLFEESLGGEPAGRGGCVGSCISTSSSSQSCASWREKFDYVTHKNVRFTAAVT